MKLDNLISKYLDGELNRTEDAMLRKILSEDISAREEFDAHVLIHAAMKEDAKSIKPSMNLVGKTEDQILSRILAEQGLNDAYVPSRRINRKPVLAFASMMILLLIFSVFTFMDDYFYMGDESMSDVLQKERNRVEKNANLEELGLSDNLLSEPPEFIITQSENSNQDIENITSNVIGNSNTSGRNDNNSSTESENRSSIANSDNNILASGTGGSGAVTPTASITFEENESIPALSDEADNDNNEGSTTVIPSNIDVALEDTHISRESNDAEIIEENSVTETNEFSVPVEDFYVETNSLNSSLKNQVINPRISPNIGFANYDNYYGSPSQINLNTFLGSEMAQSGFGDVKATVTSNFSQSLGYLVNSSQELGLEIGFTKYSYEEEKVGRIPNIVNRESGYIDLNKVEVRESGSGNLGYIEFPYTMNTEQQMMWGAVYFDQRMIAAKNFSLNGRISLGATNEGPLGYGRLYGKYDVFNWFSVNVGADARAFWWNNPAFGSDSKTVKSSFSLIYGFEIRI